MRVKRRSHLRKGVPVTYASHLRVPLSSGIYLSELHFNSYL
jgi:hypothetical protein